MNQRLKDLLADATEIHDDRATGVSYPVVDQKIFAELIINECANVDLYWLSEGDRIAVRELIQNVFGVRDGN